MNPATLTALKSSIEHWEDNLARAKRQETLHLGIQNCALCRMFHSFSIPDRDPAKCCEGCPVAAAGHRYCEGSPYDFFEAPEYDFAIAQDEWDRIEANAQSELDFLRSLYRRNSPAQGAERGDPTQRKDKKMMTVSYVAEAVRKVYETRGDPEAAHSYEDRLHQEVLKAIAQGTCENPAACAQQALMTQGIDFPRWCA